MTGKHKRLVSLLSAFAVNASHAQEEIQVEGRLDPHCGSTLMLSELGEQPKTIQTHGVAFYIFPETIPNNYTGCQIVWLENGHKLVTKHYELGILTWAKGQEPKDVKPFFCLYGNGPLIEEASFNINRCPRHSKDFD